jgi:cation:H+ antiporter
MDVSPLSFPLVRIVLCFVGFGLLWFGAEKLVHNSLAVAKKLNMSELAAGLTFVALGTSLPEFFVMLNSIWFVDQHAAELSYGTIVGSNIVNIGLVLGVGLIFSGKGFSLGSDNVKRRLVVALVATVCICLYPWVPINKPLSLLMVSGVFLYFLIAKNGKADSTTIKNEKSLWHNLIWIILGASFIWAASLPIVLVGKALMIDLGFSTIVTGSIFFALSTSFPEIITSLVSIIKFRKTALVLGNVLGSNIINIFMFGVLGLFFNLSTSYSDGKSAGVFLLLTELILAIIILWFLKDKKVEIPPWVGIILISISVGYFIFLATIS